MERAYFLVVDIFTLHYQIKFCNQEIFVIMEMIILMTNISFIYYILALPMGAMF